MSRHSTACTAQSSNGFPLCEEFTSLTTGAGPWGPRDWMPSVQFNPASRLGIIRGYTGQGVATSNLAGRLLSSLIGNCPSGLEKLPLAHHHSPDWEPEPVRWMVVRYMQKAFQRIDETLEAGRPRPWGARITEMLARH